MEDDNQIQSFNTVVAREKSPPSRTHISFPLLVTSWHYLTTILSRIPTESLKC